MQRFFSRILLSANDIGSQKYSTHEIAEKMKASQQVNDESLMDFASTVKEIFENDTCNEDEKNK